MWFFSLLFLNLFFFLIIGIASFQCKPKEYLCFCLHYRFALKLLGNFLSFYTLPISECIKFCLRGSVRPINDMFCKAYVPTLYVEIGSEKSV